MTEKTITVEEPVEKTVQVCDDCCREIKGNPTKHTLDLCDNCKTHHGYHADEVITQDEWETKMHEVSVGEALRNSVWSYRITIALLIVVALPVPAEGKALFGAFALTVFIISEVAYREFIDKYVAK